MRRQEENEWRERFCTETPEQGKYSFVSGAACISFHTPYTLLLTKSILMHVQVARQSISSRNLANRTQTDSTSAVPACTTPALCSLGPGLEELSLSKSIRTRLGLQPHWDYWTCSQPARSSFQGTKEYSLCTIWHQFEEQLIGKLLNNQFLCSEPQWQTVLLKSKLQSGTPWKMTKQSIRPLITVHTLQCPITLTNAFPSSLLPLQGRFSRRNLQRNASLASGTLYSAQTGVTAHRSCLQMGDEMLSFT